MTNASATLAKTGIADAINDGGRYDSATRLASYARVAADVISVVGAQKPVPTLDAVHQRIYVHRLSQEDARAHAAYGQHSQVGKIREIHQELPGRIHIVLIRQPVGF
jgi:ATP phosphoribosyltransferase regulatory subunit HisZ